MEEKRKQIDIPFQTTSTFIKYTSYYRGYHAYKDVWNPLVGDDSLTCEQEERNVYDENAVIVIFDGCISKKIVGHVPFNWSKLASMFLKVPNSCIRGTVTGKRVNRGSGLRLEIPWIILFMVMLVWYFGWKKHSRK